jgi:hypothetical protein
MCRAIFASDVVMLRYCNVEYCCDFVYQKITLLVIFTAILTYGIPFFKIYVLREFVVLKLKLVFTSLSFICLLKKIHFPFILQKASRKF